MGSDTVTASLMDDAEQQMPRFLRNPNMFLIKHAPRSKVCSFCWYNEVCTDSTCEVCNDAVHSSCARRCKDCSLAPEDLCCFICQKPDGVLVSCSLKSKKKRSCLKTYHVSCLTKFTQHRTTTNQSLLDPVVPCPRHFCRTCDIEKRKGSVVVKGLMATCIRCPVAYHCNDYCIPAGTVFLSQQYLICQKHFNLRPAKLGPTFNAAVCFSCSQGGHLLLCDECPAAYHPDRKCLGDAFDTENLPSRFVCDDCEIGRRPLYGDIVWAKLGGFRFWPAEICHPKDVPDNVEITMHEPGQFVVRFFGDNLYSWLGHRRVYPFCDQDEKYRCWTTNRNTLDRKFKKGLDDAIKAHRLRAQDLLLFYSLELKPSEYQNIKKNSWHSSVKALKASLVPDTDDSPACSCTKGDGCGADCLNRVLKFECHDGICGSGEDSCQNRRFQKCMYVQSSPFRTNSRGWGLKAMQFINKGDFVIEYAGELIDEAEYKHRLAEKYANDNSDKFYFLHLDNLRIIDAEFKANKARFMNHSCEPNCMTEKWIVQGDGRIGLFACRDILPGEELTFHYNFCPHPDYVEKSLSQMKCQCGAASCQGFIGRVQAFVKSSGSKISNESGYVGNTSSHRNKRRKTDRKSLSLAKSSNETCSTCSTKAKISCIVCSTKFCHGHIAGNIGLVISESGDDSYVCLAHK